MFFKHINIIFPNCQKTKNVQKGISFIIQFSTAIPAKAGISSPLPQHQCLSFLRKQEPPASILYFHINVGLILQNTSKTLFNRYLSVLAKAVTQRT